MRASSLHGQGGAFNEPRHALAHPERVARRARHPGRRFFGYFLVAVDKKVTRSSAGRVEAFAFESDPRAGRARKTEGTRSEKIKSKELDDQPFGC